MRDERAAKPFSEVARDLRALDLKKTHALQTRNQNRKSAHATWRNGATPRMGACG
jgi:hypothetical protein